MLNKIFLMGRLTRDPELRRTQTGTPVASFSLAVDRDFKDKSTGVTTLNVAKRLLDYGFHAPTIYFPLLFHESLMIEPTETESLETLDAFIEAMRRIAAEAAETPNIVKDAPTETPVRHPDDTAAAVSPCLTYADLTEGQALK